MKFEPNEYSIKNKDWRKEENLFSSTVELDSGFVMKQYDILLGVEKMTPFTIAKFGRYPTDTEVEIFGCMLLGE